MGPVYVVLGDYLGEALDKGVGWRRFVLYLVTMEGVTRRTQCIHDDTLEVLRRRAGGG